MPLNQNTKKFTRAFSFVDEFDIGDEVTREALDQALDDLAGGINGIVALGYQEVGDWAASTGAFPTARPDLSAILVKDAWRVTSAGTVSGQAFAAGDFLVAIRAGGGVAYTGNWLRVTGNVAAFQSLASRAELAATQSESAKIMAVGAADAAADSAAYAETSASVLGALAERADIGPFASDGATVEYNLPFDPVNHKYVELFIGNMRAWLNDDFTVVVKEDSPSGYGIRLTAVWPPGIVIRGSLVRPAQYDDEVDVESPILTLRDFGVDEDGVGDQGPAIQAALEAASGRRLQGTAGAVYRIVTPVDYTGSVDIDLSMSRVLVAANILPFRFSANVTGPYALTAAYDAVGAPLALQVAALPAAPAPGQIMWIASKARDPANRDNGSGSQQYRCAEPFVVGVGSTTTIVVLQAPLTMHLGVQAAAAAGDEPFVDAYTVANETVVVTVDMAARCRLCLPGGGFEDGHGPDGWAADFVHVRGYHRPQIHGGSLTRCYSAGLVLSGTYAADVYGLDGRWLENNAPTQTGYLLADRGWATRVHGLTVNNCRHAYTTTKATTSFTAPISPYLPLALGRTSGSVIDGGHATGGQSALWDTHADGDRISFVSCVAEGGGSNAFGIRGRNILIDNPVIRNCKGGIQYFTEYDNNDPAEDDRYNNGKRLIDFTSGQITSPQMEVWEKCIDVRAADVLLGGVGRYRSASWQVFYVSGGTLRIAGSHEVIIDGARVPASGSGILHLGANNAYNASAFPTPRIVIDGVLTIDARSWTGDPITALWWGAGTQIVVRGVLRLLLPAGATLFSGAEGGLVCEGAGRIEYSRAGDAAIIAGLSAHPIYLVDLTSGAVMDGTTRRNVWSGYNQVTEYTDNSLIVRHSAGSGKGLRLRDTNTAVSDGQAQGGIAFETNDASNPALDAARILFRGVGAQGFVETVLQRTNTAGALYDAISVRNNGDVRFYLADGTTVGLEWDASNGAMRLNSSTGPLVKAGTGSPEGIVTAPVGSLWLCTDGGAGTTLYVKQGGAGNTGWAAK